MYLLIPNVANDTIKAYIECIGRPCPMRSINVGMGRATFVGDTHGALDVTAYILLNSTESDAIVFLGDIVDRGKHQLYNLLFLLESSILNRKIVIVRGNHESYAINRRYGFESELISLGVLDDLQASVTDLYGKLPFACVINGKVLGVHGGIPRKCTDLSTWEDLPMDDALPENECSFEILWNDPSCGTEGFGRGQRGEGTYTFGQEAFKEFMSENKLEMLVRGHEVKAGGCEFMFDNRLASIFSSRYHGGIAAFLDVYFRDGVKAETRAVPHKISWD